LQIAENADPIQFWRTASGNEVHFVTAVKESYG
jgi:hypothetical protein